MRQNKYSPYKIIDFPEKIRALREGRITAPIYVRIKPTNRCSHNCSWCAYASGSNRLSEENITGMHDDIHHQDQIPFTKMREVLDDLKEMGVKAVTYSGGGEPLMYPDICETMERTLNYGIDLSIITNGQGLQGGRSNTLASAKWVRVSIDYTTAEQMAESRNVVPSNFYRIMANLEAFSKIKEPDCDLGINYIVHKGNYQGLYAFTKTLKDIGVDNVRFSPMWTLGLQEYHAPIRQSVAEQLLKIQDLVDDNFSVNQTYDLDSTTHSPHRGYTKCPTMQIVPVIAADQMVYGCHNVAYTEHGRIGSIKDRSFKDLWFSQDAKFDLNPDRVCTHQCAAHVKNLFLLDVVSGSQDNFV
jgi:MoaA/NifB/PqqE/SkfB family radical SAM enzyme